MSHVLIDGPAGKLEGFFEQSDSPLGAVLCHPHPLYGGSMDDMVLQAVNRALASSDISSLRFNFRGVGHSGGVHDKGIGEVADVLAAVEWMKEASACSELILAGYSFGAGMALGATLDSGCDKLVLVAPPVIQMPGLAPAAVPTLVILGESDQIVDAEQTSRWFGDAEAEIRIVDGADHFFFHAHEQISDAVTAFVGKH